jgi:hypothetical protein
VYPNPLSGVGIVSYFIAQNSNVRLSLFDLQGHKLKTFVHSQQTGFVNQAIDISDLSLSNGLYLIHLSVNERSFVKPVVVNK